MRQLRLPGLRALRVVAAVALIAAASVWSTRSRASEVTTQAVPAAQPALGAPSDIRLIGSSPEEAAGETWGFALEHGFSIVRYTQAAGAWQTQPAPTDTEGHQLTGFTPAPGALAGRATPTGGVAILGSEAKAQQLLVRDPGGAFHEAPAPGAGLLSSGESLYASSSGEGALMAPVEEPGGHTGVFVVPAESVGGVQSGVLFFDGSRWTREPICAQAAGCANPCTGACKAPGSGFQVLAIDASSPQNAWLLAKSELASEGIALFARDLSGPAPVWVQQPLGPPGSLGAQFAQSKLSFREPGPPVTETTVGVSALSNGQPLTVTGNGVWVDGRLRVSGENEASDFTLFYTPQPAGQAGQVTASWCDVPPVAASLCKHPLGSELPAGDYRSFAWSAPGPFGERVITGLDDGVTLSLQGEAFARVLGAGGESGTSGGAAFSSPQEGWLANRLGGPLTHLTMHPAAGRLQSWPVPFRHPLTAIAQAPGSTSGDLSATAIAVGDHGQVARYTPGEGWAPEALLGGNGVAQTPDLRGVAWPEPGRAYAVGTNGAMWLWRAETGLWEPDPARPPNLFLANFTGIAFDPSNPTRGYAVGQQGLLLGYGKSWAQEPLPTGLEGADFTSISFAGSEALVTYLIPHFGSEAGHSEGYSGGLLVNSGSGWSVDQGATAALGPEVPVRVAGLPDGGAVIAGGDGALAERQGAGAPWQPSPAGPTGGYPAAVAAFREAGALRAVVSVDATSFGGSDLSSQFYEIDYALRQPAAPGQPPIVTSPYPLPAGGFLEREGPGGWQDEEHAAYPAPDREKVSSGEAGLDYPAQPDAVLALALDPDGSQGWAVGGQTGGINRNTSSASEKIEAIQTAGVMRYPASAATPPTGFAPAPVQPTNATTALFAVGGNAQCATACADLAEDELGPDAWLSNALARAGQTAGLRAFLYTGGHLAPRLAGSLDAAGFAREESRYVELLGGSGGPAAVFAAPSSSDLNAQGTLSSFDAAFASSGAPQGSATAPPGVSPVSRSSSEAPYYSFDSTGASGGRVRVIVLDYSGSALGSVQQCWLAGQLASAKAESAPAIVIGNRPLGGPGEEPADVAVDGAQTAAILINGTPPAGCSVASPPAGASAYFFDSPQANRSFPIASGGASIPAYGSGTLGYVSSPIQGQTQFLGASGFLLAEVDTAARNAATNRAPVSVRLIPDISDLAIDATNGLLLRRSQVSLFDALARRPHAGMLCTFAGPACEFQPDPYVPIPSTCQGPLCATAIMPNYTFSSSKPDVGDFVQPDPASPEGTTVLQGLGGKPVPDSHSGLFCAYNAGTTTVTVQSGGLSSSEQVTVLAGSVQQPCGTVPLRNPPAPSREAGLPVPLPAPAPGPAPAPTGTFPPPPIPAVPAAPPPIPHHPSAFLPPVVPAAPAQLFPIPLAPPPPGPNLPRPTPPSGTAQVQAQSLVSQPVGVAEHEHEEEHAAETVHHMAAYTPDADTSSSPPAWALGLVLVAAAAGAGIRRPRARVARADAERGLRAGPGRDAA